MAIGLVITTPIGSGCQAEGPHGPDPCIPLDAGACNCGCSALDECEAYFTWQATRLAGG